MPEQEKSKKDTLNLESLFFSARLVETINNNYVLHSFDKALKECLDNGFDMQDRTGVGVRSMPGVSVKIDISERVPVPTGRKTNWKSMLKEYLWFLTGSDKIDDLNNMGSKVWNFWNDKDFADRFGFDDSSIGYGYGPNLIRYGADLKDKEDKGFNQIDYVLNLLKNDPTSRRILIDFWRPDKLAECKLPPCHMIYQWIVNPDTSEIHCSVYQRSSDAFVGNLSTNLQGAAFYTYMLAQQADLKPATLTHTSGHFHIYHNHFDLVKEYLERDKPNSPILKLNKKENIYDYTADDFELKYYNPLPSMKVPIAV